MAINIRIADPNNEDAYLSLLNWLNNNEYLKANGRLEVTKSTSGQGSGVEVMQLILNSGFDLANLVLAIAKWRTEARDKAAPVTVTVDERRTELSVADLADGHVVLRALTGAADPRRSECVLIGVEDYMPLRRLPAARRNVARLRDVLADPGVWGIPGDRLHTVEYPRSAADIRDVVSAAAAKAADTLLVYFAGHGLYHPDEKLLLALPEATGKDDEHTVPWKQLAEVIQHSNAARKVVVLDCCYAGLALDGQAAAPPTLGDVARAQGVYVLAAAQKHEEASAPDDEEYTAFTGELLRVLHDGIPADAPGGEFLNLNAVHQEVRDALRKKHRPQPDRFDPGVIGKVPYFRNNLTPQAKKRIVRDKARRDPWRPRLSRGRGVAGSAVVLVAALAALLLILKPWAPSLSLVPNSDGVSLTQYCATLTPQGAQGAQGFVIDQTSCVQKIDLDKACNYSYETSGLKAEFTSPDPQSAICVNPKTGVKFIQGIPKMAQYCGTLAPTADVTATYLNPDYKNTWICQVKINMNLACDELYNGTGMVARQDSSGYWNCYQ
jgi:hypothetical protein